LCGVIDDATYAEVWHLIANLKGIDSKLILGFYLKKKAKRGQHYKKYSFFHEISLVELIKKMSQVRL